MEALADLHHHPSAHVWMCNHLTTLHPHPSLSPDLWTAQHTIRERKIIEGTCILWYKKNQPYLHISTPCGLVTPLQYAPSCFIKLGVIVTQTKVMYHNTDLKISS